MDTINAPSPRTAWASCIRHYPYGDGWTYTVVCATLQDGIKESTESFRACSSCLPDVVDHGIDAGIGGYVEVSLHH